MKRAEKELVVAGLKEKFENHNFFYIADSSGLTVAEVTQLRKLCYDKGVEFKVAKNTLIKKAFEQSGDKYEGLYAVLKNTSAIFFTENSNAPAKILKEFRKGSEKPVLKAAYIDSDVFIGDENIDMLANLKSKEELIGEIIGLLQSPVKNVIGALQSGGNKLSGILKTLADNPVEGKAKSEEAPQAEAPEEKKDEETPETGEEKA